MKELERLHRLILLRVSLMLFLLAALGILAMVKK